MKQENDIKAFIAKQKTLVWRRRIFMWGITALFFILTRFKARGQENVPATGPTILMINHTDYIDPGAAMAGVRNIRFTVPVAKVETLEHKFFGPFVRFYDILTVSRGQADRRALSQMLALLEMGTCLVVAPEGTRQRNGLAEPRDGLVYLAIKTNAIVVPTAITDVIGWNRLLFKGMRGWVNVTYGQPFRFKQVEGQRRPSREMMDKMMQEAMYQLAANISDPQARGIYSDLSKLTTDTIEFVDPKTGQPLPVQPTQVKQ